MTKQYYRRLPLENLYNARDLGGYITKDKKVTKWFRFLRTDDLHHASAADQKYLKEYGVTTVIDLRSKNELATNPNPFKDDTEIDYHNCSLLVGDATKPNEEMMKKMLEGGNVLGNMYLGMLQQAQPTIKEIFEIIGESKGTVLYHCTAGKDRTGVISALLLGLAGASSADIVNNYIETYHYLNESPFIHQNNTNLQLSEEMLRIKESFLNSDAKNMEMLLKYIHDNYGTIPEYLTKIGIEKKILNKIKESFVL